jgi:hypothetical protein
MCYMFGRTPKFRGSSLDVTMSYCSWFSELKLKGVVFGNQLIVVLFSKIQQKQLYFLRVDNGSTKTSCAA